MYANEGKSSYATDQKRELLTALYALEEPARPIITPEDAVVCFLKYRNRKIEYFFSLSVDNKNNVIKKHEISKGTVDQAPVFLQEILKATLRCDGSGIILGHNHPGGDPTPSQRDIELTMRVKEGTEILGLRLLDHIIVSKHGHYSFTEEREL